MNTWGISGPAFLALYGTALVVVTAAAVWVGWRRERVAADDAGVDEYEVALLNGGERLAAVVALVNLDRQGALELGDRLLRDSARRARSTSTACPPPTSTSSA